MYKIRKKQSLPKESEQIMTSGEEVATYAAATEEASCRTTSKKEPTNDSTSSSEPETTETRDVVDSSASQVGIAKNSATTSTVQRSGSSRGQGSADTSKEDVATMVVKDDDGGYDHPTFHLQTSTSSEATPDMETLLDVQAYIETIHNRHGDESTAPESSDSYCQSHNHGNNRRYLHLVQSNDEDTEMVVDTAVVSRIGKYINSFTGTDSASFDHDTIAVSPEMLCLVQQWIEVLPSATTQKAVKTGGENNSFDTVEVDPETMAAIEACMELVTKENHNAWQGRHQPSDITVGAATVAETHSLSGSHSPSLASDETGGASGEDILHVDSGVATRSRARARDTDSNDRESDAAAVMTTVHNSLASNIAINSTPPSRGDGQSMAETPSLSPVQSAVDFWEKKKTGKPVTDDMEAVRSQKSVAGASSISKAMPEKSEKSDTRAEGAVLNALSFHSADVLSQTHAGTDCNLPSASSYRSYGHSSSSSSSATPSKTVSRESPTRNSVEASEAVVHSTDKCGMIGDSLGMSSEQTTELPVSSVVIAQSSDECNTLAINSTTQEPAETNSYDSADVRVRDLIHAVERWGGEGSFLDYTSMNMGSLDSGALEALEELVIDAESSTLGDQSTVDDTHIPQELSEELKNFLDAFQARKPGKAIKVPSNLIRVKQDPPTFEPEVEAKEDPPIKNTFSRELTRWISGNENPEPNPEKESPLAEHSTSHLDPECDQPQNHGIFDEKLTRKHAARTNHLHPDITTRTSSLAPNAPTESSNGEDSRHPSNTEEARKHSTRTPDDPLSAPLQPESPSKKLVPPRPEVSLIQTKDCEEKKEDSVVFDGNVMMRNCSSGQNIKSYTDVSPGGSRRGNLIVASEDLSLACSPISRASSPRPKPETPTSLGGSKRRPRISPSGVQYPVPGALLGSKYFIRMCSILLGNDPNEEEKFALAQFVRFAFDDVKRGRLPESSVRKYGCLSVKAVKTFIDAVAHSQKHSELEAIPSEELQTMKAGKSRMDNSRHESELLTFVGQIASALEIMDGDIPFDFTVGPTDSEANAIEYDIKSGFVRQDYTAQYTRTDEEIPWWEATAKLAVVPMDILDDVGEKTDESDNETSSEEGTNSDQESTSKEPLSSQSSKESSENVNIPGKAVKDDIDDFWKSQQELRERRMQFRDKAENKEKAVELPHLHATSYSYNSQSTGISGSYSKTTVLSKPTAESLDTLDESWLLKRSMAGHGKWSKPQWLASNKETILEVDAPEPVNGTEASNSILDISCRWRERRNAIFSSNWVLPYEKRSSSHAGYQGVDIYSLQDSSNVPRHLAHRMDNLPWEKREVKQFFLHEQSVVNRNWFGRFKRYSSVSVEMPVCKPRSMEMPVKASEWTEDWYRTPALHSLGTNLSGSAGTGGDGDASEYYRKYVQEHEENDFSEDEEDWEDGPPECGTLRNVKLKPGERISRVTPDLTSSLRRSRWRKKFFPRGTFPY